MQETKDREIAALFREGREDAREAVDDALLRAWNSIPPQDPELPDAYLAKPARRAAIDGLRRDRAKHRWKGEAALALEELGEVLTDGRTAEEAVAWAEYVRQRGPAEAPLYKEDGVTVVGWFVIGS